MTARIVCDLHDNNGHKSETTAENPFRLFFFESSRDGSARASPPNRTTNHSNNDNDNSTDVEEEENDMQQHQQQDYRRLLNASNREPFLSWFNLSSSIVKEQSQHHPQRRRPREDWIDNTRLIYIPWQLQRSKVWVKVRPQLWLTMHPILQELDYDLLQCLQVLPKSVHGLVRRTVIWINGTYQCGPKKAPQTLNHSTAHHHPAWLLERAGDVAQKADYGIEIYNATEFCRMRLHWNGCGLILHELIHLLHQHVLGLDYPPIIQYFKEAQQSGLYQCTLRRDWAGQPNTTTTNGETDMHYAMINHKEFFAEMSVTYLAYGYPPWDGRLQYIWNNPANNEDNSNSNSNDSNYNNKEERLPQKSWQQQTVVACSPPLMEPKVVARVNATLRESAFHIPQIPIHRRRGVYPHCNKLYPFTRGQLRQHDPRVFEFIHHLWTVDMAQWNDTALQDYGNTDGDEENEDCCPCWFPTGLSGMRFFRTKW